jgi:2-phospho-L-lactate transferase CofD
MLRKKNIMFSKADEEDLPARIERIWYINPYGQEIRISANPHVLGAIDSAQCVIYSIGSLYTSIVPSLILKGVGAALASTSIRNKILILNSSNDRETGPSSDPYTAVDFIAAIAKACSDSRGFIGAVEEHEYKAYVTHVVHLEGPGAPKVDRKRLGELGIETIRLYGRSGGSFFKYDEKALIQALEAVIGKRDLNGLRSRRNTLEGW